jgi:hypothetical protein
VKVGCEDLVMAQRQDVFQSQSILEAKYNFKVAQPRLVRVIVGVMSVVRHHTAARNDA